MDSYPEDFPFGILDVVELLHLKRRRPGPNSFYVDCPFCGDHRGKMNVNYVKNVWRCNYCGEYGGMLNLYARYHNITSSDAYREICDALQVGGASLNSAHQKRGASARDSHSEFPGATPALGGKEKSMGSRPDEVPQSPRASVQEIHQTLSLLFGMLSLSPAHRAHLRSPKRGLTDEQINSLGFKSTPPPFLCRSLTERLMKQGCTVQGVPGFYLDDSGTWSVKFYRRTSGILIPAVGIDGLIHGAQILLDTPIKDKDDPPDKAGTKYIWLSSSSQNMGVTSGSPVHFIGNPFARTIYITEGLLKADIAHCLMNRSFVAIAGANNVRQLDPLFTLLAQNGTELIVEANDMDKFSNTMTNKGASKIYLMAKQHGLDCRPLTWNPNYKGVDDWRLALRRKEKQQEEERKMNYKEKYLWGLCKFESIADRVEEWHTKKEDGLPLADYLGLSKEVYEVYVREGDSALQALLELQRRRQNFRIYQLDFGEERKAIPFAFLGIKALHKANYEQPPAAEYRLVCEDTLVCPADKAENEILEQIFDRYNGELPEPYCGRSLAPSDVVELYDQDRRAYFYRDTESFVQVKFSPVFAKPMQVKKAEPSEDSSQEKPAEAERSSQTDSVTPVSPLPEKKTPSGENESSMAPNTPSGPVEDNQTAPELKDGPENQPCIDIGELINEVNGLSKSKTVQVSEIQLAAKGEEHIAKVTVTGNLNGEFSLSFKGADYETALINLLNAINDYLSNLSRGIYGHRIKTTKSRYPQYKVCRKCGGHRIYYMDFRTDYAIPRSYSPLNKGVKELGQEDLPYHVEGEYCMDCNDFCETDEKFGYVPSEKN